MNEAKADILYLRAIFCVIGFFGKMHGADFARNQAYLVGALDRERITGAFALMRIKNPVPRHQPQARKPVARSRSTLPNWLFIAV